MKTSVLFWAFCLAARTCFGTEPSGEFVELHSCDLYTGGCTASSESTLLGRQLLRVWAIRQGTWNHQDLADLKVAVLEVGSGNLAEKEGLAEKAEIYVPKGLDTARKEALLSWVTSQGAYARLGPGSGRRDQLRAFRSRGRCGSGRFHLAFNDDHCKVRLERL